MSNGAEARIGNLPHARYSWYVRLILRLQRRKYGRALERNGSAEKLAAIPDCASSALFSERERAAIAYAEAVTDSTRRVDDALFARLQHSFAEQEIVELTALIAFQNMSSKFNAALGVPAQGFCTTGPRNH